MTDANPPRRSWRRIAALAVASVVALVITAGATAVVVRGAPQPIPSASVAPVATTTVMRGDLTKSRTFPGTLAYGAATTLKGTGDGILTALPAVGDVIDRGSVIYRVNDQPVVVFLGDTPLFRSLDLTASAASVPSKPLVGADVAMVAANLAALGYPAKGVSDDPHQARWSTSLSRALARWQASVGLEATGTIAPGDVVVLPRQSRVGAVTAQVGDAVAGEILSITGTAKAVSAPVKSTEVAVFTLGAAVTIALPDGRSVPGTVSSIGTVVTDASATAQGTGADVPTMDVTIAPAAPGDVAGLDYAAVEVTAVVESRTGVLTVPVEALLALQGGGYALQLPSGDLVAVTTGMFAQDRVEVSGAGISDGLTVVTAS